MTRGSSDINESTRVSLFPLMQAMWAIGITGATVVFFIAMIYFKADAASEKIGEHDKELSVFRKDIATIKEDLVQIRERLGIPRRRH